MVLLIILMEMSISGIGAFVESVLPELGSNRLRLCAAFAREWFKAQTSVELKCNIEGKNSVRSSVKREQELRDEILDFHHLVVSPAAVFLSGNQVE
jgi:hypothetical protein